MLFVSSQQHSQVRNTAGECYTITLHLHCYILSGTPEDLVPWLRFSASIGAATLAGSPLGSPTLQFSGRRLTMEFLLLPVREFVSGCLLQHLVALPTESLASGIIHYLPHLGANIDEIFSKLQQQTMRPGSASPVTLELLSQKVKSKLFY